MKTTTLIFILFSSLHVFSQKALNFGDAKKLNIETNVLDSIYQNACHVDTNQAAFGNRQEAFQAAYQNMLNSLSKFMQENGCEWEIAFKGFHKIYFTKEGKIVYFLYSYKNGFDMEKEAKFNELLNQFIATYTFPLTAPNDLAQCGSVTYVANTKE